MEESKRQWWKESIAYQIYPRSFQDSNGDGIGDLRGIINRLDYLQYLGIDVLWLSPVYDSPNDDNGYDIRDYHDILAEYGTMADMDELLTEAKKRGIRIIMDLVANHTSDEHTWFIESRQSKDNPKRDWYIWKPAWEGNEPTNWESCFSGSAWEYDESTGEYFLHCFSKKQPDLNWENPEARQAIYDMMAWWMDRGIAGFRVDAITFIKKNQEYPQLISEDGRPLVPVHKISLNQPGILDFLQEMKRKVLVPRNVLTVAEAPGVPIEQIHDFLDETEGVFNMLFQFDHVDLDVSIDQKAYIRNWQLTEFKQSLAKWQNESNKHGWMALFLENHDHVRSVTKFGNDGPYRETSAKMLAAYYFLMRGTPFIYQGQEIGMTNCPFDSIDEYRDIGSVNLYQEEVVENGESKNKIMSYLGRRSRDHGRTPMQWHDQPMGGFTTGTPWLKVNPNYKEINVEQNIRSKESVLQFYRKLIQMRRENISLVYGDFQEIHADSNEIGGYTRTYGQEKWTVLCNFVNHVVKVPTPPAGALVLSNIQEQVVGEMQPYEALIYKESLT